MKKILFVILVLLLIYSLDGCIYDFIAPEKTTPVDTTATISFASQIQPIFTENCILCHKTGNLTPDLTSGNAYNQINSSKYINTASPAQSLLYRRITSGGGFTGHKTVTSAQAALILAWIQQGAKNN